MVQKLSHFISDVGGSSGILIQNDGSRLPPVGLSHDGMMFKGGTNIFLYSDDMRKIGRELIEAADKLDNNTLFTRDIKPSPNEVLINGVVYIPRD